MENVYTKSGALAKRIYFGATLIWEKVIELYDLFKQRVLSDGGTFIENPIVFNNESLLLSPNAFKAGKLYSAIPNDGAGDFTVDRNSTATYIGQDGLIKTALANVPRIDWRTGVPVVLIEAQGANLIGNSESLLLEFTFGGDLITEDVDIAPDGNLTSDRLKTDSRWIYSSIEVLESTTYTFSFYCKNNGGTTANLAIYDNSNDAFINSEVSYFNQINNSEYSRVTFVFTTPIGSTSVRLYVSRSEGLSGDRFLWGVQLEQASTASSYIPTNGTTVTRLADNISVPTPTGVTSITETIDGVDQNPITTIPATYSLPVGNINKVKIL